MSSDTSNETELLNAVPTLASLNVEKTIEFYERQLGFDAVFEYEAYFGVKRGEIVLHFWLTEDKNIPKQTSCYIYVKNIEPLYKEYKHKGVIHPNGALATQPYGVKEFSVLDGDGNLLRFGELLDS